ncbi:MAG: hypothetical protein NT169_27660 [Chloroflexi bacterium]|nr:hypothetical protein [Chloroflexota bacterium]
MTIDWWVFGLGVLGGALAELLKWFQLIQNSKNLSEYKKGPIYWIITALMMLAGGALAVLYGVEITKPLLAVNIGISAPLILKGLAGMAPALPPAQKAIAPKSSANFVNFIAGR